MFLFLRSLVIFPFFLLLCFALPAAIATVDAMPGVELPPPPPTGAAASYLIMDAQTGSLLAAKNIDDPVEPASLAKMMTVYVAGKELRAGRLRLEDMVVVGERAWRMGGSRMYLDLGSSVSVSDLLYGIIVQSGNDAAVALAEHIAGSEHDFAAMMNEAALELGMTGTRFVNSSGMPHREMQTTARDLAALARALILDHPDLYARHAMVYFEHNNIRQRNRNHLLRSDATVDGIKTGYTRSAGYCLASSAQRNGMRLIAVVLGADSIAARTRLSEALLEYGFTWFETRMIFSAAAPLGAARVWKAPRREIQYGVPRDLYLTMPRGMFDRLRQDISLAGDEPLLAPVRKYQKLGTVTLSLGETQILDQDLVALAEVPRAGLLHRIIDTVRLMFH